MNARKPVVGGNWKMNLDHAGCSALTQRLLVEVSDMADAVEVLIYPPFPYLHKVWGVIKDGGSSLRLGAQNCCHHPNGAFTGEVSLSMLRDVGVSVVLIGHSERRHVLGETDGLINAKVKAALEADFEVTLCIGETAQQRKSGQTDAVNAAQLRGALEGVGPGQVARVVIAYEPVWAIGTGQAATAADAQAAHAVVRRTVAAMFDPQVAEALRIVYGGSVNKANATELFAGPDVDGGLIGGSSLEAEAFLSIIRTAAGAVDHQEVIRHQ